MMTGAAAAAEVVAVVDDEDKLDEVGGKKRLSEAAAAKRNWGKKEPQREYFLQKKIAAKWQSKPQFNLTAKRKKTLGAAKKLGPESERSFFILIRVSDSYLLPFALRTNSGLREMEKVFSSSFFRG